MSLLMDAIEVGSRALYARIHENGGVYRGKNSFLVANSGIRAGEMVCVADTNPGMVVGTVIPADCDSGVYFGESVPKSKRRPFVVCAHCGSGYIEFQTNCVNCGAPLPVPGG